MILDGALQFSNAQALALAAGSYDSTNTLDLGVVSGVPSSASGGGARDLGIGDDPAMKLLVQVSTAFTSAGAATLQVAVEGAPDNGSGAPGTFNIMAQSDVFAKTLLIAGARLLDIDMPRPQPAQPLPRFIKLVYIIGTATTTAGNITAYLVLDRHDLPEQSNAVLGGYPPGVTVAN
jgi:hypothetical protein